jgi:hypothetical protein
MKTLTHTVLLLMAACWCSTAANAAIATVYTYSGNLFNVFTGPFDATMSVSGSFTMPDALPANQSFSFISPSSFSFSDGLSSTFNPITNINANLVLFQFLQTDSFGNISAWDIQVAAGDYTIPGQETNTLLAPTTLMEKTAVYFEADQFLKNANSPHPQTWYAFGESSIDVSNLGWLERGDLLRKHNKSKHDIIDGTLKVRARYVHDGDEFVHVETDEGRMSISWKQHVVAYYPPK